MALMLYNSLTRRKEEFTPLHGGRVGIYVCGPTVYGHAHLGHAKSYVSFDVLVRYLRYLHPDWNVTYVQNITDVGHLTDDADAGEDKIEKAAKKESKHPMALAEYYTRSYFEDMDRLNCVRPDISPRASGHIVEQIELVKKLLEKGYAYEVSGSVYFDVSKFENYGRLSGRNIEDMLAGARVEVSADKRNPADFALWKKAEPNHIMQWPSPWGMGFPGWHLECSVMSTKYLGQPFDIHGGGLENQFPHHECEIAQSEAANGVQFARYWVHNNMVTVDGQKMGKSLNNFITLKQAFSPDVEKHERLSRKYHPLAVRQLILNSHYRSPIDFSDAALSAAQSGFERITGAVLAVRRKSNSAQVGPADESVSNETAESEKRFREAMDDDLNTSVAVSVIFELVNLANKILPKDNITKETLNILDTALRKLGGEVLGIVWESYDNDRITANEYMEFTRMVNLAEHHVTSAEFETLVNNLIASRKQARDKKDFGTADAVRTIATISGVELIDKPDGTTTWRWK